MVGKKGLLALACASVLGLGAAGTAFAEDSGAEYRALVEVFVNSQDDVDKLVAGFDMAEYKKVEADGSIQLNAYVTNEERARLKALGYRIGRTIEDTNIARVRMEQRQQVIDEENLAKDVARNGLSKKTKFEGKAVVPTPGDTVIQRANIFTGAVGPNGSGVTARFLYVEAFNKSTHIVGNSSVQGPTLALSYTGPDGTYSAPVNMSRFVDTDPTPDYYMYHRQLIRLPEDFTADPEDVTIRIATAATTGGAEASVETYPVSEWLGTGLPPHVAGYNAGPFFTHYQDPTETRADLDALAAAHPELVTVVNMPEQTSGYQRKSQAIMSGADPIGSAPAGAFGDPLIDTTGEITAAEPVAVIPFTATAGQNVRATVDAIPSGSTDFILTLRDPNGVQLARIDTGTSPEFINRTFTEAGTYSFEVSGYQGDIGDFTFTVQQVQAGATNSAVVLTSKEWGHLGGDLVQAEFRGQTGANRPLSVMVNGNLVEVFLATDASGALASTAAQVVDAINASPAASALLSATTYRGNAGAGIVQPRARVNLDDFLNAPASVARGPFQQHLYRIGAHRDGTKPGVFLFCQQHAREWATSLTCQQTAHELVENYNTDPYTKQLLDNVEVFISPNSNPDGAHYSMYDSNSQRKTLVNYCAPNGNSDPAARNSWGVDMNRNSGEYSIFDGYAGASSSCTSEVYAGPSEYSEPETRNEAWVIDTFPNIKFSNNIHSYGGYFMWAPGAYKNDGLRTTSPAPNIGIEKYFFEAGERILRRIKDYRGTVILPQRTGPIADVLYSAAGNSADDAWYRKGVIAYSFETGADRFTSTSSGTSQQAVGFQPCFAGVGTGGGTGACPANGSLANEGRDEAMEFAAGNFGLVESAYAYAMDTTAPSVSIETSTDQTAGEPINFRFNWDDEAAVIHYTTDGSTPTLSSTTYNNQRARGAPEVITLSEPGIYEVKWIAVDIKGNVSDVKTKRLLVGAVEETGTVGGTVPPTLSLTLAGPASFGAFTPGVAATYSASTTATVLTTAGDAKLSVSDPSATATGHLVNGAFSLAAPLQASGDGTTFADVSGSPLTLKSYDGPTSNDVPTLSFKQAIGANDALRTGTYGKTLTFTLSTTNP